MNRLKGSSPSTNQRLVVVGGVAVLAVFLFALRHATQAPALLSQITQ